MRSSVRVRLSVTICCDASQQCVYGYSFLAKFWKLALSNNTNELQKKPNPSSIDLGEHSQKRQWQSLLRPLSSVNFAVVRDSLLSKEFTEDNITQFFSKITTTRTKKNMCIQRWIQLIFLCKQCLFHVFMLKEFCWYVVISLQIFDFCECNDT